MQHIFLDMFGAKMERQVFGALCYLQGLAVVSCQMLSSQMLFCFCFFTQININIINIIITWCVHACIDSPFALTLDISWSFWLESCWASIRTVTILPEKRIGISCDFWWFLETGSQFSSLARDLDFWWFLCHGEQSPSRPVDCATTRNARNARNAHRAGTGTGGAHWRTASTLHTCSQPSIREGDIKGLGPSRMGSSPTYLGISWHILAFEVYVEYDSVPIESMYGIYANIGGTLMVNVTIYSIHGSYGVWFCWCFDMSWLFTA